MKKYKLHKCENIECQNLTNNRKYCSLSCSCKVSGKIVAEINKKNNKGFYSFKVQSAGGKIGGHNAQKTLKENNLGFYDKRVQILGGKKGGKIGALITHKICKNNKTGFWNLEQQKINGKIGGIKSAESNKINKIGPFFNLELNRQQRINMKKNFGTYKFKNYYFDSKGEVEIAINLYYQYNIDLNTDCHFIVENKEYDFLVRQLKTFLEYHPFDLYRTKEQYYKQRRDTLNKNGYKDYNLVVIR